jgi:hypothetical protein
MGIGIDPQVGQSVDQNSRRVAQPLKVALPDLRLQPISLGAGLGDPQQASLPGLISCAPAVGGPAIANHNSL